MATFTGTDFNGYPIEFEFDETKQTAITNIQEDLEWELELTDVDNDGETIEIIGGRVKKY